MALPAQIPTNWFRLATYVQISDLHIGEIDPVTGDASVSAVAAGLYASGQSLLDGWLGHAGLALQEMENFIAGLRDDGEDDLEVIVTGDITRTGDYMDFVNARDFLERSLDLRPPTWAVSAGLGLGNVDLIIPGNHDHWGGSFVALGGGPSQYNTYFPAPLPYVQHRPLLTNGRQPVFVGINSDADVYGLSHDRQLAFGKFESELQRPAAQPASPAPPHEIRIMLVHHSWHQSGTTLRMRSASKAELGRFLVRHGIKAILTGHSHVPLLDRFTVNPQQVEVHELRAGSASQLDRAPAGWKTVLGTLPTRQWGGPNSLLVHRVFADVQGATRWHCQIYERQLKGFMPLDAPGGSVDFVV